MKAIVNVNGAAQAKVAELEAELKARVHRDVHRSILEHARAYGNAEGEQRGYERCCKELSSRLGVLVQIGLIDGVRALSLLEDVRQLTPTGNISDGSEPGAQPATWENDAPLPEDDAIDAAFPTRSGRHDVYGEAMRLVGAKRSKGALVALVNWLLLRAGAGAQAAEVKR